MHKILALSLFILLCIVASYQTFIFKQMKQKELKRIKKYCGLGTDLPTSFKVDGPDAKVSQFPWSVLLDIKVKMSVWKPNQPRAENKTDVGHCSGVLISNRHILTSAHCLFDHIVWLDQHGEIERELPTEISAQTHKITAHLGGTTKDYFVKDGGYHSEAENADQLDDYDFAILELEKDLSKKKIKQGIYRPLCFTEPDKRLPLLPGRTVVVGYGEKPIGLRYQTTGEQPCPGQYDYGPLARCFGSVTQKGDSGAAFFKYEYGSIQKAHLLAVVGANFEHHPGSHLAVNCEIGDPRGPLFRVQTKLGLNYSTLLH